MHAHALARDRSGDHPDARVQELERLGRFTQELTSFARVPRPELEVCDLSLLVGELVSTFESAWSRSTRSSNSAVTN